MRDAALCQQIFPLTIRIKNFWFALKYFTVEPRLWYLHQQQFNIWPAWATVIRKEFIRHVRASKKVSRYNFVGLEWALAARQWWSTGQGCGGMLREAEITSSVILFGFNLIKWRQNVLYFNCFFYNWGHHIINTGVTVFTIPDICPCVKRYQDLVAKYIHCPVTHHNSCPRGLVSIQSWH